MKTRNTKVLLGIALALVIGLGGLYAGLFWFILGQNRDTAELSTQFEELSNKESKLNLSIGLLKDRANDINLMEQSFLHENRVVDFPPAMEELGKMHGVEVSLQSLDQVKIEAVVWALGFQLTARGPFPNVMRFLEALENYPSKIEFSMVNITKTAGGVSVDPVTKKETAIPSEWTLSVNAKLLNYLKD